jgi:hypothetical protein
MSHDVFISYASADKEIAFTVCEALENEGLKCWIAPRDILVGSYGAAIIKAINNSKLMVLVLSSHANQSEHVHREVERAAGKGINIYPFRVEDVLPSEDLELFVSSEQWLDAFPSPSEHLEQLVENVKLLLAESVRRAPSEPLRGPLPIKLRRVAPLWVAVVIGGLVLLLIGLIWLRPWADVVATDENDNHNATRAITPSVQSSPIQTPASEVANSNVQPTPAATASIIALQTRPIQVPSLEATLEDTQWEYRRVGGRVEYIWEFHPNKRFRSRRVNQGTYLPDGIWEQTGDTIIIRIGDVNNPETYKGKIQGDRMEGEFIALNPTRWSAMKIVP